MELPWAAQPCPTTGLVLCLPETSSVIRASVAMAAIGCITGIVCFVIHLIYFFGGPSQPKIMAAANMMARPPFVSSLSHHSLERLQAWPHLCYCYHRLRPPYEPPFIAL